VKPQDNDGDVELSDHALDVKLTKAMVKNLVKIARSIPPRTRFTQMLSTYGSVETWKRVRQGETSGFTDLYEHRLLHLSFEALIVENPQYHRLFTVEDLSEMRRLLSEHGYTVTRPSCAE
jgi:hypothetical protein